MSSQSSSQTTPPPAALDNETQPSHPTASSAPQQVHPSAGTTRIVVPPTTSQPKHFSELQASLSGKAYYIDGRSSTQYDAHLARPQSALVRGHKVEPITSSAYMIHDIRRPSVAQSLPPLKPGSSSKPAASRQIRSENGSLSGAGHTLYGKHHSDTIISRPSPAEYPWTSPSIPPANVVSAPSPSHVLSTYSLSNGPLDENGDDSMPTARQTLRSLLHLALFAPPLSGVIFFYAILVIFYTLFTSPLRLCLKSRRSLPAQLVSLLIGPLNLQRRCICVVPVLATSSRTSSSSRTPLSSDDAVESQNLNFEHTSVRSGRLVSIHLMAPFIALPMALCAWVMGVAWGLGAIVSDERAGDDRDERRLAQRLVDYWASWLSWGMEPKPNSPSSSERRGRRRSRPEMSMSGAR